MRNRVWIAVVLVVVVAAALIGGNRRSGGPPLDPDSTSPQGAKAVVELAERLGADVEVVEGAPDGSTDAALLLADRYERDQADAVDAWVRAGGTLVVADRASSFSPPGAGSVDGAVRGTCSVPDLVDVQVVHVSRGRGLDVPPGSTGCLRTGPSDALVVVTPQGSGRIVTVGDQSAFTNDLLDEGDNAVLAAALLAGDGRRVAFLQPAVVGSGDRTLVDLVGRPVWALLLQLAVAFAVVVAWRARRLGRPVPEPQPVQIDGSELTGAVGRMLRSNRQPGPAAALVRDRARRDLSPLLGLPLDAPADLVVQTIADRTSLDEQAARRAVAGPVETGADLVHVSRLLARIRQELTDDRSPTHD